jgi:hypothetical protein
MTLFGQIIAQLPQPIHFVVSVTAAKWLPFIFTLLSLTMRISRGQA